VRPHAVKKVFQKTDSGKVIEIHKHVIGPQTKKFIDALSFYVVLIDKGRLLIMANRSMEKAYDLDYADIEGKPYTTVIGRSDGPYPGCGLEEVLKTGKHVTKDFFDPLTQKWMRSETFPSDLITPDGRAIYIHMAREITDLKEIEAEARQAEQALEVSLKKVKDLNAKIIETMGRIVEIKDPYTAGHQRRVASLATAMSQELGMSVNRIEGISLAASIHDIGKIYLPAEILSKPGKLTETEFALVMTHTSIGHDIIASIEFPWPVAEIILQHHERLDGSGYPNGIKNGDIVEDARIIAVADVVEAMSSYRPYRPSLGIAAALKEIGTNKSTLYDKAATEACIRLFKKGFALTDH
jgi:PAS domain-containing protein